jgi:hypothetical protein
MPSWLAQLHAVLASPASPQAVRLFLLKALLHVETRDRGGAAQLQRLCQPACPPACLPALGAHR